MEVMAKARFIRITPRKARLVVDELLGKRVEDALNLLKFSPNKGSKVLVKVVRSAVANAEQNPGKVRRRNRRSPLLNSRNFHPCHQIHRCLRLRRRYFHYWRQDYHPYFHRPHCRRLRAHNFH